MDNIIEKITLYDVLGYGFPGFFFIMIVIVGFSDSIPQSVVIYLKDYAGALLASAVVLSHITGLILSEISKLISKTYSFIVSFDWKDKKPIDEKVISRIRESINNNDIKNALRNSGFNQFDESSKLNEESLGYIYSVIQIDSECGRIHGYSSALVMCRNTATAALLGGVILLLRMSQNNNSTPFQLSGTFIYSVVVLLIAFYFLLNKRAEEFRYKKYYYAVNWFILKYNSKSCQEEQKGAILNKD